MAAPTHVKQATPVQAAGASTTSVIQLTTVTTGNTIVVWGAWMASNTTPTCADDNGNTYSAAQGRQYDAGYDAGMCGFVAKVVGAGGTVNITVSWGGSATNRTVFAEEKTGVNASTTLDVASTSQIQTGVAGPAADALNPTAATTVTANCLMCACSGNIDFTDPPTAGTGMTTRCVDTNIIGLRSEDWDTGSIGSKNSLFNTVAGSARYITIQMALRPVDAGGTTLWAQSLL